MVTPDIHRIHHSADIVEQNTNFGFLFPFWDYLFRTYRPQPALGHDRMGIGLEELRDRQTMNPLYLLAMPFLRLPSPPINEPQSTATPVIRS
jgi:sterol desaturase/sphingolipid hydroxylase (fatty acid hydroxylase superfamily)